MGEPVEHKDPLPQQFEKPVRLASAALRSAQASKWESAYRYVKRINDECGGEGLEVALRAWIDTYVDHATDGDTRRARIGRMGYINADSGRLDHDDSAELPARVRWAGRLVAARAALDEDAYVAALEDLPEEGTETGSFVAAVLEACAASINGLPRGFASPAARAQWVKDGTP